MNLKTAIDIKFTNDTITFFWKTREELFDQIDSLISNFSQLFDGKLSSTECVVDYISSLDSVRNYKSDIGKLKFYNIIEKRTIYFSEIDLDTYPFGEEYREFILEPKIKEELSKDGGFIVDITKSELNDLLSLDKLRSKQIDRIFKI